MTQQTKAEIANRPLDKQEAAALPDAAGFWRRLVGFVIDWLACFAVPSLASSLLLLGIGYRTGSAALDALWILFVAVIIMTYFSYFSTRGSSPGMYVASIKLVDFRTGKAPGLKRSLIRGGLLTILIGSWFLLLLLGWGSGAHMSNGAALLLNVDYVVFLASFFGHLWITWDRKKQTLQDKLAGVVVVRRHATVVPTERPARRIDPLEWRM